MNLFINKNIFHFYPQFQTFIGNFVLTFFVAIIGTLAFESPVVILEKMLFHPTKKAALSPGNNDTNPNVAENSRKETESQRDSSRV